MRRLMDWVRRNQRWLSGAFFAFGFFDHLVTFGAFPLHIEIYIFEAYLAFAMLCVIVAHVTTGKEGRVARFLAVAAPLLAQLTIGGVLAGFVVFYTKDSVLSVSWPFLIFLAAVFLANELLRDLREHLAFLSIQIFFTLYAFVIFAVPFYVNDLGKQVFLNSTILTVLIFAIFLTILGLLNWLRLRQTLLPIVGGSLSIVAVILACYYSGLVPPIPLTLKDKGVFNSIEHVGNDYQVTYEYPSWSEFFPHTVVHQQGTPLYAYSSVFAPGGFSENVVHRWQWYDQAQKKWVTQSVVAFTLSGGREAGYRGYSEKGDPKPGKWRVSVETTDGQVIGLLRFSVENTANVPRTYPGVR